MEPANFDFRLRRGDSFRLAFILRTRDLRSQVVDALDLDLVSEVALILAWTGGALTKTIGAGLAVDALGVIAWAMTPSDTNAIVAGTTYRVRVTFDSGEVKTYLAGKIIANG